MNIVTYGQKKKWLHDFCYYGDSNFCDGKSNKSVEGVPKDKPPCPRRFNCIAKCNTVFDERT